MNSNIKMTQNIYSTIWLNLVRFKPVNRFRTEPILAGDTVGNFMELYIIHTCTFNDKCRGSAVNNFSGQPIFYYKTLGQHMIFYQSLL